MSSVDGVKLEAHTSSVSVPVSVFNSIVYVRCDFPAPEPAGYGLGCIYKDCLITAYHVYSPRPGMHADRVTYKDVSGVVQHSIVSPKGRCWAEDLWICPTRGPKPPALAMALPKVGAQVMCCASREGNNHKATISHFSWGTVISAVEVQTYPLPDDIQVRVMRHDCATSPGSSGCPVVGVDTDNCVRVVGFHVGRVDRGAFGIMIPVTAELIASFEPVKKECLHMATCKAGAGISVRTLCNFDCGTNSCVHWAGCERRVGAETKHPRMKRAHVEPEAGMKVALCPVEGCSYEMRPRAPKHGDKPCSRPECKFKVCHFFHPVKENASGRPEEKRKLCANSSVCYGIGRDVSHCTCTNKLCPKLCHKPLNAIGLRAATLGGSRGAS